MKTEGGFISKWWGLVVLIVFIIAGGGLGRRLLPQPVKRLFSRPGCPFHSGFDGV